MSGVPAPHRPVSWAGRNAGAPGLLAAAWWVALAWALVTSPGAIMHGHPAYWGVLAVAVVVAVSMTVAAVRAARRARAPRRRRWMRGLGWAAAWVATALGIGVVVYGHPHAPHATVEAAMAGTPTVAVEESLDRITLTPQSGATGVGVVFWPGARTDARSYVPLLQRIAERGHVVVVAKPPMSVAPLATDLAASAMHAHPEVGRWVVGGHSFGGVPAARWSASGDPRIVGQLLWATYARDASMPTLALYGTQDRLIPPAEARGTETADRHPRPIDGATHTSFADYGPVLGDGTETRPRDAIQADVVTESMRFLDGL